MQWKMKPPAHFPAEFAACVTYLWNSAVHAKSLGHAIDFETPCGEPVRQESAKYQADLFRYYRWCVRQSPGYALFHAERDWKLGLRQREAGKPGFVQFFITIRPKPPSVARLKQLLTNFASE